MRRLAGYYFLVDRLRFFQTRQSLPDGIPRESLNAVKLGNDACGIGSAFLNNGRMI
jgi:hypothetical protein